MQGEVTRLPNPHGFHRCGHGVWDVVKFEIQKHGYLHFAQATQNLGPVPKKKLKPNLAGANTTLEPPSPS
jgi:hypothetical protein